MNVALAPAPPLATTVGYAYIGVAQRGRSVGEGAAPPRRYGCVKVRCRSTGAISVCFRVCEDTCACMCACVCACVCVNVSVCLCVCVFVCL